MIFLGRRPLPVGKYGVLIDDGSYLLNKMSKVWRLLAKQDSKNHTLNT